METHVDAEVRQRELRSTTLPLTCCTLRCVRSWASTCNRKVRWLIASVCASTSATLKRSKDEQIKALEDIVNAQRFARTPRLKHETGPSNSRQKGAMALFGEKYGDNVRVLTASSG
ncbi:hypothetical protein ACXX9E_29185 [Pseudomonas sp. GNP014]